MKPATPNNMKPATPRTTLKASTPRTSRLAAVANARRRQRKERLSANSPMASPIASTGTPMGSPVARRNTTDAEDETNTLACNTFQENTSFGSSTIDYSATIESSTTTENENANNENVNQVNTIRTLSTDDESISTWSHAQSTVSGFTDDSFGFATSSSKPKPSKMPTSITSRRKPPISIITEEVLSPSNILSPANTSNITFRDVTSPQRRVFSPTTPRMNNGTPRRNNANPSSSTIQDNPRSMMLRIDELTQERDRLRMDSQLFKRKLQMAIEEKSTVVAEKDEEIAELMKSIGNLTVLIDESDQSRNKELQQAQLQCKNNSKTIRELEQELSNTVCQLNKLRGSYEMLKKSNTTETSLMEQRLQSCSLRGESVQKKLEEELGRVTKERDELECKFDECMEELGRVQGVEQKNQATIKQLNGTIDSLKKQLEDKDELEANFDECMEELGRVRDEDEKNQATIKRQTATIESLKKQLETSMSKANKDLSHKEQKITEILDEKFEMETALQERIYELESELKSMTNIHKEDKHNHESIIKMLREQLSSVNDSRETTKASMLEDMEEMKKGYDESIVHFRRKISDLESQLVLANQETETMRNELTNAKSVFVTRLEECNKERNEATAKLNQLTKDFEDAKMARGKDIELLESELEKAYTSKLESDKQLKDTKRQLQNALHSLDEMALDGGKMRHDLEDIMNSFHSEKDGLHRELVELRHKTEEQKNTIYHLNQDNRRYERSCDELRAQIRDLEGKLRNGATQSTDNSDRQQMLQLEIKYLKSMLEKATSANTPPTPVSHNPSESSAAIEELRKEKYQLQEQIDSNKKFMDELRANEKVKSAELSKAKQTIQMLKTKEKYLESRVESLASQITKTVQEYETRLGEARELGRM